MIEQATRIDLEQVKQEYRARIETTQDGEAETFVRIMSDLNQELRSFAHISVEEPVSYYRMMDGVYWENTVKKELYESDQVQAFYQWEADLPYYRQQLESAQPVSYTHLARFRPGQSTASARWKTCTGRKRGISSPRWHSGN